jgi:hypothetical protein
MIASIAIAALFCQNTLLEKVIPRYTGQNGYEEYVQAAIILEKPENKALDNYVLAAAKGKESEQPKPPGLPENATLLDLYRFENKALGPALDLIRAGNEKKVIYPKWPITAITLFPEVRDFRIVAKLFARLAYVSFAAGDSRSGTRALLDGLTFSRKIQCLAMIHLYVGNLCEQTIFGAMEHHVDQISLPDSEKLLKWADSIQDSKQNFMAAAKIEQTGYRATFDDLCNNPKEYDSVVGSDETQKLIASGSLRNLSPARKAKVYASITEYFERPWIELQDRMKMPESEWLQPLPENPPVDEAKARVELDQDSSTALLLLASFFSELEGGHRDIPATLARYLIQERLAGIYAAVIRYRWINNALPTKLADVFGKEPLDPTTGKVYTYEQVDKSFRVTCKAGSLGDVGLVYRGAKPDPGEINPN